MKLTKQGVRDLNSKTDNGRKYQNQDICYHRWKYSFKQDFAGQDMPYRKCKDCGEEEEY